MTTVRGDEREWKAREARANALPRDHRIVHREMESYLWKSTSGDGTDVIALLKEVLGLFETSAAQGRRALDVTGADVAAFCDELLHGTASYSGRWRARLNRDVAERLAE